MEDEKNVGENTHPYASEVRVASLPSLPNQFFKALAEWKRLYPYYRRDENLKGLQTNYARCFYCGEWFQRRTEKSYVCSNDCDKACRREKESLKPDLTKYEWVLDMKTWEWSRK